MRTLRYVVRFIGLSCWSIFFAHSSFSQSQPLPKAMLWRISGNGLSGSSYLFGTIHLQDRKLFQFTDSVYAAIRQSNTFALELHPDTLATAVFSQVAMAASNGSSSHGVTKKNSRKSAESITRDRMSTIVDLYLYAVALDQGKRIEGLESLSAQQDEAPGSSQDARDFLDGGAYEQKMLERLKSLYVEGDAQQLYELIHATEDSKEQNQMAERNTQMAQRITDLVKQGSLFAAVGAAHLAGDMGLVRLLRLRGFLVEPVLNGRPLPAGHYAFSRPPAWQDYVDPDGYFRVFMPGRVQSFPFHEMGYRFHGTVDLTQLRYYFTGSVPIIGMSARQKDSLLGSFKRSFTSNGKFTEPVETLLRDSGGVFGKELTMRDRENFFWFRFQLILRNNRAFFVGVGGPEKDMLTDMVSSRFVTSFQPLAPVTAAGGYIWNDGVAQLWLPRKPETANIPSGDSTMRAVQWSTADTDDEIFYVLVRTDANPSFVISDDVSYFKNVTEGFGTNTGMTVYGLKDTLVHGSPARHFFARPQAGSVLVEALLVKQGSRIYALLGTAADSAKAAGKLQAFFRSFRLSLPAGNSWSVQSPAEGRFAAWSPGPWMVEPPDENRSGRRAFYSYDSLTSVTYQLVCDTLSEYTWSATDTSLLHLSARDYVFEKHPQLNRRFLRMQGLPALELITACEDSTMVKKIRMVIKGRVRYTLFAFIPGKWVEEADQRRFFEDFHLPPDPDSLLVYHNKPSRLLEDLISDEPGKSDPAFGSLEHAPFEPGDFPMLLDYGLRAHAPRDEFQDPGKAILGRAGALAVDFPQQQEDYVRELSKRYRDSTETGRQRSIELLDILVRMKTESSHKALLTLLQERLPDRGDAFTLFYHLRDSTALARILYPQLLDWSADSILGKSTFSLHPFMMEDKRIDQAMVESHRDGVEAGLERLIRYYSSSPGGDDWWHGYRAIEFISTLKGGHWDQWLQRFVSLPQPDLKESAAVKLAGRNQKLPSAVWDTLASVDRIRLSLYRQLEEIGQLKLFPKKYKSQAHFAMSSIWESNDDEEPTQVHYVGTEDMEFQGSKRRFYLYRVVYMYDGERSEYLGVAGPYKLKDQSLYPADPITGVYWEQEYTRGLEKKQLRAYLAQFIEAPPSQRK